LSSTRYHAAIADASATVQIIRQTAEDRINCSLPVRGSVDDEPVIFLQLRYPILNLGRRVALDVLVRFGRRWASRERLSFAHGWFLPGSAVVVGQ